MYRVAGYVKLAKLWERNRDSAIEYHNEYFAERFSDNEDFSLCGVYVDITGNKDIKKRQEMVRLLRECFNGKVDVIAVQTKAYLAANPGEFCYLIKFLFELENPIQIITDDLDYRINTIENEDHQREALYDMANNYAALKPSDYPSWRLEILNAFADLDD